MKFVKKQGLIVGKKITPILYIWSYGTYAVHQNIWVEVFLKSSLKIDLCYNKKSKASF